MVLAGQRILGVASTAYQREYSITGPVAANVFAGRFDDACDLEPENFRIPGRRGIVALALYDIGAVYRGCLNLN